MSDYKGGDSVVWAYAAETATHPSAASGALGTAPATPLYAGYSDMPAITGSQGAKAGYTPGSKTAAYLTSGRQLYRFSQNIRVASPEFLQYCLQTSTGLTGTVYEGMYSVALWRGIAGAASKLYRWCMCDSITFNFTEGDAQELMATINWVSPFAPQTGATLSPSYSTLTAPGTPLMWHNTTVISIGGTGYRSVLSGVTCNVRNGIEPKGIQIDNGEATVTSRGAYALLPHQEQADTTINWHSEVPAALINEALGAHNWGAIVCTADNTAAVASGAKNYTLTIAANRLATETTNGGDSNQEATYSTALVSSGVSLSIDTGE